MRVFVAVAVLLLAALAIASPLVADCVFDCRRYATGDAYCSELISSRPRQSMASCEVQADCGIGLDGTTVCETYCVGPYCYDV